MEKELGIVDPESPTQKPGSDLIAASSNKHRRRMLSLSNTYSKEEISEWFDKFSKPVVVEKKFDGGSSSIFFKNGRPIKALTRGDGETGEDITENVKLMNWSKINTSFNGEVRGELIISKEGFKILNRDNAFQNARNLLSGTMKLLNREIFKERSPYILFKAYFLEESPFKYHHASLEYLTSMGFDVGGPFYVCNNKEEMLNAIDEIEKNKESYDIEIDGAVIKIDDIDIWKSLGETAKYPRWGRAYKYKQEEMTTTVREIIYQVGMSGKITPKAKFDPIFIDGSEVEFATLNNKDYMTSLGIRVGDTVSVRKAAGIIPECVKVISHAEGSKPEEFPKRCPSCGTELKKLNPEHVDFYCLNEKCPEKLIARFFHFTHVMGIDGFSNVTISKLISANLLSDIESLYTLKEKRDEIVKLDRLGEKSVDKFLKNIEDSKQCEFHKFLAALAIPGIGVGVAEIITEKFNTPEKLLSANLTSLSGIQGIGEVLAISLFTAIHDEKHICYSAFHNLLKYMSFKKAEEHKNTLAGKTFAITGSLSKPRSEIEKEIVSLGGKVVGSVSAKTTYLINNDTTSKSSKNLKAKECGVKIISEEEFRKLL